MKKISISIIILLFSISLYSQTVEDKWVDSVFNSLSFEQKVGQLMNVRVNNPGKPFNPQIVNYIKKYNIGGVTFFRTDAEPLLEQVNKWQELAQTPLMVGLDAEWGLGMRINDGLSYPYQMTLGAVQNDSLIAEMGCQIAEQCLRIGVNVNYAPDVDVNNEPRNPVIGFRSFSENPFAVARKGLAYSLALQKNGVMTVMKHFPGHGNTVSDSHNTLPKIDRSLKEIENIELYPFKYLINNGVDGIMIGHLYFPALEPVKNTSSSLSKNVVTKLLKDKMGFDGLIFTDGLDMKGAYNGREPDSICYYALMAGNDVLLLPMNINNSIKIIVNAANNDIRVKDRVEESCKKILKYKYRLGLNNYKPKSTEKLMNDLNKNPYLFLKQRLYNEAVTMLANKDEILPLNDAYNKKIAVVTFGKDNSISKRLNENGIKNTSFLLENNISEEKSKRIIKQLKSFDYIIVNIRNISIYVTNNFGITDNIVSFITKLSKNNKLIFNLFGSPYAFDKFEFKKTPVSILIGYEDNDMTVNTIVDVILGKICPRGKLPVSLNKYKYGTGLSFKEFLSPETLPVSLIDNEFTRQVDSVVLDGIDRRAFPGCQIIALKDGKIIYDKSFGNFTYDDSRKVQDDDVYDIASLTKVFASTFALMKLYDEGKIDLNSTLGDFFPFLNQSDKGNIKLIEFLTHQSGMVPWIPIYKEILTEDGPDMNIFRNYIDEEHTVRVAKDLYISEDFRYKIYDSIIKSKLKDKKYKYSDVGFYFIPKIVESVTNQPFETYLDNNFYKPLNLNNIFYKPLNHIDKTKIIPTENDMTFRKQLICGDVQDQIAALFGGISGHAGLFSNAKDLAVMMQLLLNNGYANGRLFLSKKTIKTFTTAPFTENENRRGIGFDKPDLNPHSVYYIPSKQSSMQSFGHTGFTGTFAWADPKNNLVVIFLSNRVYPDVNNNLLSELNIRTIIHDLFYDAVK